MNGFFSDLIYLFIDQFISYNEAFKQYITKFMYFYGCLSFLFASTKLLRLKMSVIKNYNAIIKPLIDLIFIALSCETWQQMQIIIINFGLTHARHTKKSI